MEIEESKKDLVVVCLTDFSKHYYIDVQGIFILDDCIRIIYKDSGDGSMDIEDINTDDIRYLEISGLKIFF